MTEGQGLWTLPFFIPAPLDSSEALNPGVWGGAPGVMVRLLSLDILMGGSGPVRLMTVSMAL